MSKIYTSSLLGATLKLKVKDITKFVRVNETSQYLYEEAGFGGSADIFRGKYTKPDGSIIDKLARELDLWHSLGGSPNIIELLGVITGIGPLPSPVSELCAWNLQDYLERKRPPPRHMKVMTDTLRGLRYMHELGSGPIAHGDIKLANILVTANETAMICDFGRSRQPRDLLLKEPLSNSSPFAGTVRYMSPELFVPNVTGPTPAADMWAYGCVALEVLCRVQPYHEIKNEFEVARLIKDGCPPSDRPTGPRSALVNDTLWGALSLCWKGHEWRPTSGEFLNQLTEMLQNGEIPSSPVLPDLFPMIEIGPIVPWPDEIQDLKDLLKVESRMGTISSSLCSNVWLATLARAHEQGWRRQHRITVAVKVPRLNVNPENQDRHDQLQNLFRKVVKNRYGVRHRNIIDLLGVDSSFSPHAGLVLEYCYYGSLMSYCKGNRIDRDEFTRPAAPRANAYSLISDIVEGLEYMHSYPVPIPQGDLTPILTGLKPYSNHRRDDFAGAESVRGQPPGTLANVYYGSGWITNGIWSIVGRCWKYDPLLRPSAKNFLKLLKDLADRELKSLPVDVVDLVGKIRVPESGQFQMKDEIARYVTTWNLFDYVKQKQLDGIQLTMVLYETTYAPKWYSRAIPIIIKLAGYNQTGKQAGPLIASICNEITIAAQLNHPNIPKLLGIDSSYNPRPSMAFEFYPRTTLDTHFLQLEPELNFHEYVQIQLKDVATAIVYIHEHISGTIAHGDIHPKNISLLPDGKAKLTNFSCAFQYIVGQPTGAGPTSLSSAIATPQPISLYSDPEREREKKGSRVSPPTTTGDVWSFGTVILATFIENFRNKSLEDHAKQLIAGVSPCDAEDTLALDGRILPLVHPMLALDPSHRPSARAILDKISMDF
ncbi:Pkinase domain-containing protein [Ceratobasidium theobromae]|uniref:Pkinase domain-containing protein n=1 Tax=Ceratobasidium theobromae TaxID=1582974 RepID=A0A5N5QH67_9AGAM|nr:Pkinase domain-containing protein [Ceratobasidium theobromae]